VGKLGIWNPLRFGPRKDVKSRDDRNIPDESLNN
jgi:hypothetical protein